MNEQQDVEAFMDASGQPVRYKPDLAPKEREFRARLIQEELDEYVEACDEEDIVAIADALGDLLYVVLGAASTHGLDLSPIFNEIHRSNMTKVVNGEVVRRPSDGKILKPASYEPPKLDQVIANLETYLMNGISE